MPIVMTDLGFDEDIGCFKTKFDYENGKVSISEYYGPPIDNYRQTHDYAHLLAMGVSQEEIEDLGLRKRHFLLV